MHVGTHPTRHLATLSNLLLPLDLDLAVEAGSPCFTEPHCIAAVFGLYHGRSECGLWRTVSEDSESIHPCGWLTQPFLLIVCSHGFVSLPCGGLAWHTQMFQHTARFSDSLFPRTVFAESQSYSRRLQALSPVEPRF